jgi:hypothetical protein
MSFEYHPREGQNHQWVDWYRPEKHLQIRVIRCTDIPNIYWFEVYVGPAWALSGCGWGMSLTYFLHQLDLRYQNPQEAHKGFCRQVVEDAYPRPVWHSRAHFMHDWQWRNYVARCVRRHNRRHPETR